MAYRDINDPRDPWAFRNKWSGSPRNDYLEFWIVIPLGVGLLLLALLCIAPLFIRRQCPGICPRVGYSLMKVPNLILVFLLHFRSFFNGFT